MKLRTVVLQSKLKLTALATRMRVVVGDFLAALLPVDNFSVSDASSKQPRKDKTENLAFTDQMTYVPNKRVHEGIVITDSDTAYFAQDYVVGAPTAQTYAVSGGNFSWFMSKVLTETPVLSELIVKTLPSKVFTETVNVTDDINGAAAGDDQIVQYFKITTNLALLSDTINSRGVGKVLNETPSVTDQIAKSIPSKVFSNSTSATDTRVVTCSKPISNTCGAGDTINSRNVWKVVADTPTVSSSGALRMQNYTVDMTYFAEDYVGSSRTFS